MKNGSICQIDLFSYNRLETITKRKPKTRVSYTIDIFYNPGADENMKYWYVFRGLNLQGYSDNIPGLNLSIALRIDEIGENYDPHADLGNPRRK